MLFFENPLKNALLFKRFLYIQIRLDKDLLYQKIIFTLLKQLFSQFLYLAILTVLICDQNNVLHLILQVSYDRPLPFRAYFSIDKWKSVQYKFFSYSNLNSMSCPIKANSNTIELTVRTSCCWVLDLLCVTLLILSHQVVYPINGL